MMRRFTRISGVMIVLLAAGFFWSTWTNVSATTQPKVEVVFCLDTTGSMGGLIEGAKVKIWSIANQIVRGKPTPDLRIGLVGYRDYGDYYVTRIYQLNNDLDTVFKWLMSFRAEGGGDTPEHVNRALDDAVHMMDWSNDEETLKLIFLVGDCPPHMDYRDGFDYRKICKDAVIQDIIINTIQCGNYPETVPFWQEIAKLGEGNYASIVQEGGMQLIETPFDEELAELSVMLEETIVPFGSWESREKSEERMDIVKKLAPVVAAERAAFKSADSEMGSYDLIDALKKGVVSLEELEDGELPPQMQRMTLREKRAYLAPIERERENLISLIEELSEKRSVYLDKRIGEASAEDSFDRVVQRFIEEQAADKGIRY